MRSSSLLSLLRLTVVAALAPTPTRGVMPLRTRATFHLPVPLASAAPAELPKEPTKLDDFLTLLGRMYAGASVVHALDFATTNALPALAGVPAFGEMTPPAQAMAALWCLLGFAQLLGSSRDSRQVLALAYGGYEVALVLATGAITSDPTNLPIRLGVAIGLQAFVYYCYVTLRAQSIEEAGTKELSPPQGAGRGSFSPKMMAPRTPPRGKGSRSLRDRGISRVSSEDQAPKSFQENMEKLFGRDLFQALVVLTGVLCYPLMLYGIATKPH